MNYRGRLAPTPTGYLHLGHARTFWIAQERARAAGGALLYRNENLDSVRCKPEYTEAAMEDCRWIGLNWEGDVLHQSDRLGLYREAFEQLKQSGYLFPARAPVAIWKTPLPRRTVKAVKRFTPVLAVNKPRHPKPTVTGVSVYLTESTSHSKTRTMARNSSWPGAISEISPCGRKTACPPINSPSWWTTQLRKSLRLSVGPIYSSPPRASSSSTVLSN